MNLLREALAAGGLDGNGSGGGSGLTNDVKQALLACFDGVAWEGTDGNDRIATLEAALTLGSLVSISAVFTQGANVVYDTDSLDSLRQYLTVTATYTLDSVEIVAYTLSGTLTVGTSTITVSYGGKTDTFDVTVTAGSALPTGYTQKDYVVSTVATDGGNPEGSEIELKAYTDLNVLSCTAEFGFTNSVRSGGAPVLGARSGSGAASHYGIYVKSGAAKMVAHGTNPSAFAQTFSTTEKRKHTFVYTATAASPSEFAVDDNAATSLAWSDETTVNVNLIACGIQWGGQKQVFKGTCCGEFTLTNQSNEIVGHYIPCVRDADNVIGFYETVDGVFYTAATAAYATIGNESCIYDVGSWTKMSVYNKLYNRAGEPLSAAYNKEGEQIYTAREPVVDYTSYTSSVYANAEKCAQGFAAYGKYLFLFNASNQCKIIDVDRNNLLQTVSVTGGHANTVCFGGFYDEADEFPLLYVSSCTTKPIYVYVYRITRSESTFTFTAIRTLKFSNAAVGYYCDGCVDPANDIIYMVGYTKDSSSDDMDGENKVRLSAWDLTDLTDNGDNTFTPEKVTGSDVVTDYFVYALTGMDFRAGLIWSGTGDTTSGAICGIDPETGEIVHTIATHQPTVELEGICWISNSEAVVGFYQDYFYKYKFEEEYP